MILSSDGDPNTSDVACSLKQSLFGLAPYEFKSLEDVAGFVQLENLLWSSQVEWDRTTEEWKKSMLKALELSKMDDTVAAYSKTIARLDRDLMPNKVFLQPRPVVATPRACLASLAT